MDGEQLPAAVSSLSMAVEPTASTELQVSGARKAAVLMAALGPERAAGVIQHLREDEVERLSIEMAKLSAVGAETTESILGEVAAAGLELGASANGGVDFARDVIERALGPERAAQLLGRLSAGEEARPFAFLRNAPPERVAGLLRSESPQMIALVLASLQTSQAAGVLARLPEPLQPDVALRIVRMGVTGARVIEQVEEASRRRRDESAGGHPQPCRPLGRAQRAREPRRSRQGARRGGAGHAVRLRGHRQARRAGGPATAA